MRRIARGEGLDIDGDRVAVALRQHRCINDNVGHGRSHSAVVRRIAGLQHFRHIRLAPVFDPGWRDVRDVANSFRVDAAGEAGFGLDGSE
jgi:hypothetical protein